MEQKPSDDKEKWINSPWIISLGTALFSFVMTIVWDYVKQKPVLTTVVRFVKFIGTILSFELKTWWVILCVIFLFFLLYIMYVLNNKELSKPDFYNYRKDKLKKWIWTWNWEWSSSRSAWLISNLTASCPVCKTSLIDLTGYSCFLHFQCPRCDFEAKDNECDDPYKIEKIILDNIEKERQNKTVDINKKCQINMKN